MEMGTLTENLSTLRSEMGAAAHKQSELEKSVLHLEGEKLGL